MPFNGAHAKRAYTSYLTSHFLPLTPTCYIGNVPRACVTISLRYVDRHDWRLVILVKEHENIPTRSLFPVNLRNNGRGFVGKILNTGQARKKYVKIFREYN